MRTKARSPEQSAFGARPFWAFALVAFIFVCYPILFDDRLPFESEAHRDERIGQMLGHHGVVTGRVVDELGRPKANVAILLFRLPFRTGGSIVRRFETDANGMYRSEGLARGRYRIELEGIALSRQTEAIHRFMQVTTVSENIEHLPDFVAS